MGSGVAGHVPGVARSLRIARWRLVSRSFQAKSLLVVTFRVLPCYIIRDGCIQGPYAQRLNRHVASYFPQGRSCPSDCIENFSKVLEITYRKGTVQRQGLH